jgi:hypothetical protein
MCLTFEIKLLSLSSLMATVLEAERCDLLSRPDLTARA